MNTSVKIDAQIVKTIKKLYKKYQLNNPNEYVIFFAKVKTAVITVYRSKKEKLSLTISDNNNSNIKKILNTIGITNYEIKSNVSSNKSIKPLSFNEDQIGSDEVGTGDFFGPITVVAALVKSKDLPRIKELGIKDSKKLNDEEIRKIAKIAIKEFKYSSLVLPNVKYNELYKKGFNINKIKCYLHNQALSNLHQKYPNIKKIYMDQFESEKCYYKHLENEKKVLKGIYFHINGEAYFPSVALASVIARYSFLEEMDKLNKKYKTKIPFGASAKVDEFAKNFVKKFGLNELNKIVKQNFSNYARLTK